MSNHEIRYNFLYVTKSTKLWGLTNTKIYNVSIYIPQTTECHRTCQCTARLIFIWWLVVK